MPPLVSMFVIALLFQSLPKAAEQTGAVPM
jgi:hypothetical protein